MNARGLGNFRKRRDVLHYIYNKRYSIVCLEDTHWTEKIHNQISHEWGYKCMFSSYTSQARGTAILFKNDFQFKIHNAIHDTNGNFIILDMNIESSRLTLVCLYGPNKDDPTFFTAIQNLIKAQNNQSIIMVGDWNILLNPTLDGRNYRHINNPKGREAVHKMMNDLDLYDIWRDENPNKTQYTWRRSASSTDIQMGRLDFFLVSGFLLTCVVDQTIELGYRSDHSLITLSLDFGGVKKGKTFWKFNQSLLRNKEYIKTIKDTITEIKVQYAASPYDPKAIKDIPNNEFTANIDPMLFFEMVMLEIRGKSIRSASKAKNDRNKRIAQIESELKILCENSHDHNSDEIITRKEELETLRAQVMEGVLIRAKARWVGEAEKVTKYFCNLENRHFISKKMTSLKIENEEIFETDRIVEEVKNFYQKLYKSQEHLIEDINLQNLIVDNVPKLTNEEAKELEGEITYEEAGKVLSKMKNGKSPGSTGFSVEFFKFFWKDIGHFWVKSINYSLHRSTLSNTQKEGIITCIPKSGKCKKEIKNWRPITLLNVSYKIASGCIAQRLRSVLHKIINTDQSGFMSGRFIGDNIRLVYDTLSEAKSSNKRGMLILIDFEKAFDTVAWSFLKKALHFFNFSVDFIKWVKTFANGINSRVIINNNVSSPFTIERGLRQGDPISPYLFLIVSEILAHKIRLSSTIKGYQIKEMEIKISQYADDTSIFLDGSKESFEQTVQTLSDFSRYSGLKINDDKTKVIWFGCPRPPEIKYMKELNFEWNPANFRLLGINFTIDLEEITERNIQIQIEIMKTDLRSWRKRHLTPFGKATIIKSLMLSKIIHILSALPNPTERTLFALQNIFLNFLWDGKNSKIKNTVTVQKISEGGLGIPDIKSFTNSLKLTWLRRIVDHHMTWNTLLQATIPKIRLLIQVGPEIAQRLKETTNNRFWRDFLNAFTEFSLKRKPVDLNEFVKCSFLYNTNIKIGGETIRTNYFIPHNVVRIQQLENNGRFMNFREFTINNPNLPINYVTYTGIIQAIKRYKIKSLHSEEVNQQKNESNLQPHIQTIVSKKKGTEHIYKYLIHQTTKIKGIQTWEQRLNINIQQKVVFEKLKYTTLDTKLRWLQYRILHNILTTNKSVAKYNPRQEERCSFCHLYPETIEHLFWHCQYVIIFWTKLGKKINENCNHAQNLHFNKNIVLFGLDENIKTDRILDLIILLSKHYIYLTKVNQAKPNIKHFGHILKTRYEIEKEITLKKSNYRTFINNWSFYSDMIKSLIE